MLSEVRERKARNCGSAPCVAKGLPVKIAGAAGRFAEFRRLRSHLGNFVSAKCE